MAKVQQVIGIAEDPKSFDKEFFREAHRQVWRATGEIERMRILKVVMEKIKPTEEIHDSLCSLITHMAVKLSYDELPQLVTDGIDKYIKWQCWHHKDPKKKYIDFAFILR